MITFFVGITTTKLISKSLEKRRLIRVKELESLPQESILVQSIEEKQQWESIQYKLKEKRYKDIKLMQKLFNISLVLTLVTLSTYFISDLLIFIDREIISTIFMYSVIGLSFTAINVISNRPK